MTTYALINTEGTVVRYQDFDVAPPILSAEKGLSWVQQDRPSSPAPTVEQIINSLTSAVQIHLDAKARERGYDGILSACTYAGSTVPKFAAEGAVCLAWRDSVWDTCYRVMGEVQAGTRPIPSSTELLAALPVMVWPA